MAWVSCWITGRLSLGRHNLGCSAHCILPLTYPWQRLGAQSGGCSMLPLYCNKLKKLVRRAAIMKITVY